MRTPHAASTRAGPARRVGVLALTLVLGIALAGCATVAGRATATRERTAPPPSAPSRPPAPSAAEAPIWGEEAISFVDPLNGWLLQGSHDASTVGTRVLRTRDGGRSWSVIYEGNQRFGDQMQFVDQRHGWILGPAPNSACEPSQSQCDHGVYSTTDGGMTWRETDVGSLSSGDLRFVDRSDGWLLSSFESCFGCSAYPLELMRTGDGGRSWRSVLSAEGPGVLIVADAKTAWGFTQMGGARTTDGGATWLTLPAPCGVAQDATRPLGVVAGFAFDANAIEVACGQGSGYGLQRVYESEDGGRTWERLYDAGSLAPYPSHFSLDAVHTHLIFFDRLNGIYSATFGSPLERTSDGGRSWTPILQIGSTAVAQFLTPKLGWSGDGGVWLTVDGGALWRYVATPP